jgi:hypothetical protein
VASACQPAGDASDGPAGIATREAGWLRGDLHLHTTHSDGDDPVALVIALAEFLEDPVFLAAHPEYLESGLDYIAITDHRTVAVGADPDFSSDRLVLLLGEEFGGPGHAGRIGIETHVPHDPHGTGASLDIYQGAVDAAHAEGGIFSVNHPFHQRNPFPWDIRNHDAVEVWNAGWALIAAPFTQEDLEAWEASGRPTSPLFRRAVAEPRGGASMQALLWYEAQLSRGVHAALVGGSDRHTGLPVGFPTTWVLAPAPDEAGVLAGIRARHTFVSRTPASTQLLMTLSRAGRSFLQGDSVPVPAGGTEVSIRLRVGRGEGGLLQLVCGRGVPSDAALAEAPLGEVVLEQRVSGWTFEAVVTREVRPGDWCYPRVLDQLIAPGLTAREADEVREVARVAASVSSENTGAMLGLVAELVDPPILLFDGSLCDPGTWIPHLLQCLPPDGHGMGTFLVPDRYDRALNALTEDGVPTGWSMGALASAVLFVTE